MSHYGSRVTIFRRIRSPNPDSNYHVRPLHYKGAVLCHRDFLPRVFRTASWLELEHVAARASFQHPKIIFRIMEGLHSSLAPLTPKYKIKVYLESPVQFFWLAEI